VLFFGSIPAAIQSAAHSTAYPDNLEGSSYSLIRACQSAIMKKHSYCSCSLTQLSMAPNKCPKCNGPVGLIPLKIRFFITQQQATRDKEQGKNKKPLSLVACCLSLFKSPCNLPYLNRLYDVALLDILETKTYAALKAFFCLFCIVLKMLQRGYPAFKNNFVASYKFGCGIARNPAL